VREESKLIHIRGIHQFMTDFSERPNETTNSAEPQTSSSLLMRVRQRDAEAWQRFVKLYGPLVYRWSRQCGIQPSDASDIVQDVFCATLKSLESFRRERPGDKFRAWLWTITKNKVRDHLRRRAARPEPIGGTDAQRQFQQISDAIPGEPSLSGTHLENQLVYRALDLIRGEFADPTWQAFWRATVDGQTAADIAEDKGMTKGSVRQAKYSVLMRLHHELDAFE